MATELGLLSLTHLHKLSQSQDSKNQNQNQDQECQLNPNTLSKNPTPTTTTSTSTIAPITTTISTTSDTSAPWMWNPKGHQEADEDSWEVRAFAEDTGNVMGTTWPPRSYTCAFCRREFRSAQALGGHMNVHRRDRARLHQVLPPNSIISHPTAAATASSNAATAASSFLIPTREFVASGSGLCLLYQLPNPNNSSSATAAAAFGSSASFAACTAESASPSPSTLLSISPYPPGSLVSPLNFPGGGDGSGRWSRRDRRPSRPDGQLESPDSGGGDETGLDLELRLGHGPTPS